MNRMHRDVVILEMLCCIARAIIEVVTKFQLIILYLQDFHEDALHEEGEIRSKK